MKIGNLVLISLFAVLTAVGALIVIPLPFSPVPITLQTLFCVLSGAILGKYRGGLSQLVYLMLGISGLAVFSKGGSGIGFLFGPTGGYLIGFVAGAYICGFLVEKKYDITGMAAGFFIIYLLGVIQLKYILQIDWTKAVLIGVVPFLPGDILKILIGAGIYKQLKKTGFLESIS